MLTKSVTYNSRNYAGTLGSGLYCEYIAICYAFSYISGDPDCITVILYSNYVAICHLIIIMQLAIVNSFIITYCTIYLTMELLRRLQYCRPVGTGSNNLHNKLKWYTLCCNTTDAWILCMTM